MSSARNLNTELIKVIEQLPNPCDPEFAQARLDNAYEVFPHVNQKAANAMGDTPLIIAARIGHLEVMKWLLDVPLYKKRSAANVNLVNALQASALTVALKYEDLGESDVKILSVIEREMLLKKRACVELLLQHQVKIRPFDFEAAASSGNLNFLRKHFDKKLFADMYLDKALSQAVRNVYFEIIDFLIPFLASGKQLILTAKACEDLFRKKFDEACLIVEKFSPLKCLPVNFCSLIDNVALFELVVRKFECVLDAQFITFALTQENREALIEFILSYEAFSKNGFFPFSEALPHYDLLVFGLCNFQVWCNQYDLVAKAINETNHETVILLLDHLPTIHKDQTGFHLLCVAGERDDYELIKKFMQRGFCASGNDYPIPQKYVALFQAYNILKASPLANHELYLKAFSSLTTIQRQDLLTIFMDQAEKALVIQSVINQLEPPQPKIFVPEVQVEGLPQAPGGPGPKAAVDDGCERKRYNYYSEIYHSLQLPFLFNDQHGKRLAAEMTSYLQVKISESKEQLNEWQNELRPK